MTEERALFKAILKLVDDGHCPLVRFASTSECAWWIVKNREEIVKALVPAVMAVNP